MIVIILGGVIGVATIVYLSLQKPEQENGQQNSETNDKKDNQEDANQQVEQQFTKEQIEQAEKEFNKQKLEAQHRRERILSKLSDQEREIFEGYISDMTKQDKKNDNQSKSYLFFEFLIVVTGLLFVYSLVAILGNRFYTPYEIFEILKVYFVGISGNDSQQNESTPFVFDNPSTSGKDL